jgi:hypothetical protein
MQRTFNIFKEDEEEKGTIQGLHAASEGAARTIAAGCSLRAQGVCDN